MTALLMAVGYEYMRRVLYQQEPFTVNAKKFLVRILIR